MGDLKGQSRRSLSVWDGFIYNFLSMSVIFPWVFVQGRAAFPGAAVPVALLVSFAVQVPICIAYAALCSSHPCDAADYIYQRRAFGKAGSIAVMAGFVICILQWVAISGWLFATVGLAPLVLSAAVKSENRTILLALELIESPGGIAIISVLMGLATVALLRPGLRLYSIVQRYLFALTVAAVVVTVVVFHSPSAASGLDHFAGKLIKIGSFVIPAGTPFTQLVPKYVSSQDGWNVVLANFGLLPIAWTSLQWATYSVEQNGQIEGSGSFRKQLWMTLGSAGAVALIMALFYWAERSAFEDGFLKAAAQIYGGPAGSTPLVGFLKNILQPYPSFLAVAVTAGDPGPLWWFVPAVVALGFMASAFQVTCNCFIGVGRILVAMSQNGDFPRFGKTRPVSPEVPYRSAYWTYLLMSLPAIYAYNFIPDWDQIPVTFGCGSVILLTSLAIGMLAKTCTGLDADGSRVSLIVARRCGYGGAALAAVALAPYLFLRQLRLLETRSVVIAALILAVSLALVSIDPIQRRFTRRARKTDALEAAAGSS